LIGSVRCQPRGIFLAVVCGPFSPAETMVAGSSGSARDMVACPILKHVPPVRKTGDDALDDAAKRNRKRLCDIITLAWEDPAGRADALNFMEEQREAKRRKAGVVVGLCFTSISVMHCLDETWRITFWCARLQVTAASLGEATTKDPQLFKNLDTMFFAISMQCVIPDVCISQTVLERTLIARGGQIGDRFQFVVKGHGTGCFISKTGVVDWSQGLYVLNWESGRAVTITHRPSGTTKPLDTEVPIVDGWELVHTYSDMGCKLEKGKTSYPAESFFSKVAREGPHELRFKPWTGKSKPFQDEAVKQSDELKKVASTSDSAMQAANAAAYATPIKEQQKARAQGGLAKLAEKKKERKDGRKVVLKAPAPAAAPAAPA